MQKIKLLPEFISNKIAAGEVVQRPESVVKELIENSIDANASTIDVIVKNAGKTLIQIVDDGEGMTEDDAVMCVQRHATSKIKTFEDLEAIKTFGFRGEALSSIAAVSNLEVKTESKDDEVGTLIRVENNEIIKEKGSYSKGTSISVKNIFYNTPARRNFLKSNATELKHIIETFKKEALSQPSIHFRLFNDEDVIFDYQSGTLAERMKSVFAENILDAVINIEERTELMSVYGYIAKPSFLSKSRSDQYLFINNRFVTNKSINHAVFSAFENVLEKGDYPFFVIFIELDPAKIDINIHPSKLEVKFDDDRGIYAIVQSVVKKALGSHDLVPSMSFDNKNPDRESFKIDSRYTSAKDDFTDRPGFVSQNKREINRSRNVFSDQDIDQLFNNMNQEIKQQEKTDSKSHPFDESQGREIYHSTKRTHLDEGVRSNEASFIVLLHNKYILTPIKSGLMIIDSHVAHERILYEKALKSLNANMPFSQQLLFSQSLNVDPADYELLQELEPYLNKLGFELKFFSKNSIVVVGVPSDVKIGSEIDTLVDILNEFKKNQREKSLEVRDNIAKSFSCKAAIKAGDKLSENEMRLLVDQLFATSMPYVCPHGRPIVIKIPVEEFDKRFGRT
ncbi:MAG: DNA mismatch repair endonuclease MutL [Melioribacteraceae bacterium]|nr:DNA mismatch repair endonuclease MutL [Melioribacteraceae bacterium]MCF8395109.1 DNA mismatch repair endonuclease MutL [Melioribacteraceae bacterium]MCF8420518.1 DNA mismatch repair endonuclease MutL [Melioribacteraceae bacterium]